MKGSHCLFNPAATLRQLILSSALTVDGPGAMRRLVPTMAVPSHLPSRSPSQRPFSTTQVARLKYKRATPDASSSRRAVDTQMRDHDIPFPWIQVRREDGSLMDPERTSILLRRLNREKYSLVIVAVPRESDTARGPKYPIARIVNREEEAARASQKEEAKRKVKVASKELEVNWAIAPHDLGTRMTQLKRFLNKGYRVELRLTSAKKKVKRRATEDEAKEVLRVVKETVEGVPGTSNYKATEGELLQTVTIFLQGPTPSASSEKTAPAAASAGAAASATGKPTQTGAGV
ncbi:hypothetical protein VTK26DRAFT_1298 [Humicola hyalothermophila]